MTILEAFVTVLNMSVTASWVILIVLTARLVLRKLPGSFSCALWLVVLLRLACPVSFTAGFSLLGIFDRGVQASEPVAVLEPAAVAGVAPASAMQWAPAGSIQAPLVLQVLSYLWIAGMLVMFLYLIVSLVRLWRNTRTAVLLEPGVYRCDRFGSAFVLGIFHPKIYLPSNCAESSMDLIITHEKVHIQRLDHVVKLIAFAVACVHWFNPLAWLCVLFLGRDIERACDERVLRQMEGDGRGAYSRLLLAMASQHRAAGVGVVYFGETSVRQRILNVLRYRRPAVLMVAAGSVVVLVAAICLLANPAPEPVPASIPDSPSASSPEPSSSSSVPASISDSPPASVTEPPSSSSLPDLYVMTTDPNDSTALIPGPRPITPEELEGLTITQIINIGTDAEGVPFPMMWPVDGGQVMAGFHSYEGHTGMDIVAPQGTGIYAAQDGEVTYGSTASVWPYGKRVDIDHDGGIMTRYAHCSEVLVKDGDKVVQGQLIAKTGGTGNATGNQCHFEVRRNGKELDPALYVGEKFPGETKADS